MHLSCQYEGAENNAVSYDSFTFFVKKLKESIKKQSKITYREVSTDY